MFKNRLDREKYLWRSKKIFCTMAIRDIALLPSIVKALTPEEQNLFNRLYSVSVRTGTLILSPSMIHSNRKNLHEFERQQIVHVTNRWSLESTLFNEIRARRQSEERIDANVLSSIDKGGSDAFCNPLEQTPIDVFGRVEGIHCLSASNMAKYDHLHAVLIFKEHAPFVWEEEKISDFLDVAEKWYTKAHEYDNNAIYPFFMWNCLWRAGASIVHGHIQILLSQEPYPAVISQHQICADYRHRYGTEYHGDLVKVHEMVGLAVKIGADAILAYLTPIKEREIVIISQKWKGVSKSISRVLSTYHKLGVQSFNLAIIMPKLGYNSPFITRIVDRGDLLSKSSDIGGMELYGDISVVSSDPFNLIEAFA